MEVAKLTGLAALTAAAGLIAAMVTTTYGKQSQHDSAARTSAKQVEPQAMSGPSPPPPSNVASPADPTARITYEMHLNLGGDPQELRTALKNQPRDAVWTGQAESKIVSVFDTVGGISDLSAKCYTTGCEISGELRGLNSLNVREAYEKVQGYATNAKLVSDGFKPDTNAVFTVVGNAPLRVAFSRVLARPER